MFLFYHIYSHSAYVDYGGALLYPNPLCHPFPSRRGSIQERVRWQLPRPQLSETPKPHQAVNGYVRLSWLLDVVCSPPSCEFRCCNHPSPKHRSPQRLLTTAVTNAHSTPSPPQYITMPSSVADISEASSELSPPVPARRQMTHQQLLHPRALDEQKLAQLCVGFSQRARV